ncbi:MAG: hypothetical protein ACRBHB_21140 [Arenicella sp.]
MQLAKVRLLLMFSLLAFVMNALMPFYAVYGVPSGNGVGGQTSSLFGEKILLCTSSGFKWVNLSELEVAFGISDSGSESLPDSQHNDYFECPLCYLPKDDVDDFYAGEIGISGCYGQRQVATLKFFDVPLHQGSFLFLHGRQTRAPPLFVG